MDCGSYALFGYKRESVGRLGLHWQDWARYRMHAFHSSYTSKGPLAIAPERQSAARQKTRKTASFVSWHRGWEKHSEETRRTIQDVTTFSAGIRHHP